MPSFYVCYAWPLKRNGDYSVVEAASYQASRAIIDQALGVNKFAMHMGEEFVPLIAEFNLNRVGLED